MELAALPLCQRLVLSTVGAGIPLRSNGWNTERFYSVYREMHGIELPCWAVLASVKVSPLVPSVLPEQLRQVTTSACMPGAAC